MSLLSWMFPAKKAAVEVAPESSGLSRMEPTRPHLRGARDVSADNAQPANRKHERMARRELLYAVVREAMVRAGVLTASYKFKVLSLDGRGRQFLVMVDLSRDSGMAVGPLAEIEAAIAQSAKTRHDIVVTSVYWRVSEHVAVGDLKAPPPQDRAKPATRSAYEPIGEDEVAAFKRAIASGVQNPASAASAAAAAAGVAHGASAAAFDGSSRHGPQSYTLLTGFENTEMSEDTRAPVLSGTQYGDLN